MRVLAARDSRIELEPSPADLELSTSNSPCLPLLSGDSQTELCEFVVAADPNATVGTRQLRLRVRNTGSAPEQQLVLTLLIRLVQKP